MARKQQTACRECGAVGDPAEFHPYVFCVLKKAGRDPWQDIRWTVEQLGLGKLPNKPPLVRDLPDPKIARTHA